VVCTTIYLSVHVEYSIKVQTIQQFGFSFITILYIYRFGYFSDIMRSKVVMCFVKNVYYIERIIRQKSTLNLYSKLRPMRAVHIKIYYIGII